MTSDVSHWAADQYQLLELWVGNLTNGCSQELMMVLIIECSCPFAAGPTLGARIWLSQVMSPPCGGEAHALGPQQWTDESKAVSLMLDKIVIYNKGQLTNEVGGTL